MSASSLPAHRRRASASAARLLAWYRAHGRELPWRRHHDPYHILVSEMMLQQTQVDRVLPKYHEWLEKYPSLEALAAAPEDDVNADVAAARLQHPAAAPSRDRARVGGALRRPLALRRRDAAVVQGHRRLYRRRHPQLRVPASARPSSTPTSRACSSASSWRAATPKAHAMRKHLWAVSEILVPRKHVFDFNQALMDLGATVCVARKPKCLVCPMTKMCTSYPWQRGGLNGDHQ